MATPVIMPKFGMAQEEAVVWLTGRGHSYGQKTHRVFIEVLEQLLEFAEADTQEERWSKLSKRVIRTYDWHWVSHPRIRILVPRFSPVMGVQPRAVPFVGCTPSQCVWPRYRGHELDFTLLVDDLFPFGSGECLTLL